MKNMKKGGSLKFGSPSIERSNMPDRGMSGMPRRSMSGMHNPVMSNMSGMGGPGMPVRNPFMQSTSNPAIRSMDNKTQVDIEGQVSNKNNNDNLLPQDSETIAVGVVLLILTIFKVVLSILDKLSFMIILQDFIMAVCVFMIFSCGQEGDKCNIFRLVLLGVFIVYCIHYIASHFINKNKKKDEKKE